MGERGTQSAREVADIILLDDNFNSIVNAIAEGRQLFRNLKLSFKYLLMVHMPFVISAAIIPLLGYPLLYYPIHIVWIELFIHPTSMLVFQDLPATHKLEPVVRETKIHFFSRRDWVGMLCTGMFATTVLVASYIYILKTAKTPEHARAFSMAILGLTSAMLTLGLSRFRTLIARVITIGTIVLTILPIQIPKFAELLSLSPLHLKDWLWLTVVSLVILGLTRI